MQPGLFGFTSSSANRPGVGQYSRVEIVENDVTELAEDCVSRWKRMEQEGEAGKWLGSRALTRLVGIRIAWFQINYMVKIIVGVQIRDEEKRREVRCMRGGRQELKFLHRFTGQDKFIVVVCSR